MKCPEIKVLFWDPNAVDPEDSKDAIGLAFVDSKRNTAVGYACVNPTALPYLYNFHIEPEFQHKGYGTAALKWLIENQNVSALSVVHDNSIAIHLYESFGFVRIRNYVENGHELIYMERMST